MNLDDLNSQMMAIHSDFQTTPPAFVADNINSVNFQSQQNPIETLQIKRPTKSGDHRSDINDKMNLLNTVQFLSNDITESMIFENYKLIMHGILPCGSKTTLIDQLININ